MSEKYFRLNKVNLVVFHFIHKSGFNTPGLPRFVIPARLPAGMAIFWRESKYMDSGYSAKVEFRNDTFGDTPLLVP